jgi:hypothetical protein
LVTPVALPPGRLRLATSLRAMGSEAVETTPAAQQIGDYQGSGLGAAGFRLGLPLLWGQKHILSQRKSDGRCTPNRQTVPS